MEIKSTKESSTAQLRALVGYMEENPEFARRVPTFGSSKQPLEDHWKKLCFKLNTMGSPSRAIAEWKNAWTNLKSRTNKKIAENKKKKRLQGTGVGLYRFECLTDLETKLTG
uniref:Regulatory protein zeste n=1 Tax=Musca domestica TaxID=7370 RepID=A0A1I8NJJ0_MUSDO